MGGERKNAMFKYGKQKRRLRWYEAKTKAIKNYLYLLIWNIGTKTMKYYIIRDTRHICDELSI